MEKAIKTYKCCRKWLERGYFPSTFWGRNNRIGTLSLCVNFEREAMATRVGYPPSGYDINPLTAIFAHVTKGHGGNYLGFIIMVTVGRFEDHDQEKSTSLLKALDVRHSVKHTWMGT